MFGDVLSSPGSLAAWSDVALVDETPAGATMRRRLAKEITGPVFAAAAEGDDTVYPLVSRAD